jgi:hypothetical protein
VAAVGGGGVSFGEDQNAAAAAAGFSVAVGGRISFDYLYTGRHFLTASYVLQSRVGRARPFFEVGAGVMNDSLAVLFGAGATVSLRERWFIRPHVRLYGHVGPTLTVLPSLAAGYRF